MFTPKSTRRLVARKIADIDLGASEQRRNRVDELRQKMEEIKA